MLTHLDLNNFFWSSENPRDILHKIGKSGEKNDRRERTKLEQMSDRPIILQSENQRSVRKD